MNNLELLFEVARNEELSQLLDWVEVSRYYQTLTEEFREEFKDRLCEDAQA